MERNGVTQWARCPPCARCRAGPQGRPGRVVSEDVGSARWTLTVLIGSANPQQLALSEHWAITRSLACTRHKAAQRRRLAHVHGARSGSGLRRRGSEPESEAQRRAFRPEARSAVVREARLGAPRGASAIPGTHRRTVRALILATMRRIGPVSAAIRPRCCRWSLTVAAWTGAR